ncbi:hypothetical protein LNP17_13435 [Klebsiella variicola subsp. variicola]|nr:hypothetical protein [Klebsiella variicola subsp. variicola]
MTLSLETPGGTGSREVFYLSLAPEDGWMIRKAHQSRKRGLCLPKIAFLWRSTAWPEDP